MNEDHLFPRDKKTLVEIYEKVMDRFDDIDDEEWYDAWIVNIPDDKKKIWGGRKYWECNMTVHEAKETLLLVKATTPSFKKFLKILKKKGIVDAEI